MKNPALTFLVLATLSAQPLFAGKAGTGPKPSSAATAKKPENTIDKMMRDVVTPEGQALILGYQIDGQFCTMQINPVWNSFSRPVQQQIGDMLAASRAWDELKLVNARLYVYRTEVGRVKPSLSGGKQFVLN